MDRVTVSVVSHRQADLLRGMLADLARLSSDGLHVVATSNVPESLALDGLGLPRLQLIHNQSARGFGANHNQAFSRTNTPYFCVANPDVRLGAEPFSHLLACMDDPSVGLIAPLVCRPSGDREDSVRHFPTVRRLLAKLWHGDRGVYPITGDQPQAVDWVGGMFMLFRAEAFRAIGGFDERYFLYYEDVDICARLWAAGWKVMVHPGVEVYHDARRSSHRDPHYAYWHLASMARYFWKHLGRLPIAAERKD